MALETPKKRYVFRYKKDNFYDREGVRGLTRHIQNARVHGALTPQYRNRIGWEAIPVVIISEEEYEELKNYKSMYEGLSK